MDAIITGGVTGGLIAVALGAIEVAKAKANGKKLNGNGSFTKADSEHLEDLHDAFITHPKVDSQGVPLWYFPRNDFDRLIKLNENQLEVARETRDSIKELCRDLEK